jgi:putative ABC transport system substrate-binding protein
VHHPNELTSVFSTLASWRAHAALAQSSPMFGNELVQLSTLAAVHRLPLLYPRKEFADAGGLVTYGPNYSDNYRRAALYVDKILKGAKPGELPVEQPTKFDLVVNLKTAKAFGLEVPPNVLVRVTEVIR